MLRTKEREGHALMGSIPLVFHTLYELDRRVLWLDNAQRDECVDWMRK